MKIREIVWIVIIFILIGILIISNKQTPSKFDENAFQKRIDSLSLIVEKNNKLCDSLQLDNDKRQSKIGELSNRLTKLNAGLTSVYITSKLLLDTIPPNLSTLSIFVL